MCKLDISFITINYNGLNDTIELIQSLKNHCKGFSFEIIVVDNGSRSNENTELSRLFPDITIIRSDINLGFSGGNNLGINKANGRYLFLINNDTFLIDDSLSELVKFMDINDNAAAASPKIKFKTPENTIQFAGYTSLSKFSIRNKLIGYFEQDYGQYTVPYETPYTHGAAMILRRSVIKEVGLMPEIFFLYYEELDWCTKMKNKGFSLWFVPAATVIHKESRSTGQGSYLRTFYIVRNRLLYSWRNRCGIERMLSMIYLIMIAIPKGIIQSFLNRRPDLIRSHINGAFAFFRLKDKLN
ncbi:MAG: glycosyltransferase family 2 protein [Bacteroidetes bacterium HGW-Bacteroidetes-10]|nr:MAG: glycosyltransferase family 2 protein [Bacteroidetes bacterium HGW-Bacteroidetes-10]